MEKFDIENLQSINYYQKSNTLVKHTGIRSSDVSASGSETANSETTSDSYSSTSSGSNVSTSQTDKVDSIKSCESILKIFSFESRGFTKWNVKCTDFWKLINKHPEIKPVNCVIMDALHNKRDAGVQTDQQESEASFWARALYELQKRNLHKVALAGSQKICKFCADHGGDYESDADEDLIQLNKWHDYREGERESSASTISSKPIKPESKEFNVNLRDVENADQQQMLEMYELSDIIQDEEATNEGFVEFLSVTTEQTPEQSAEQQLELFDLNDTEQLLEPTDMIDTETTESLEGTLNVTDISETPMIEEEYEDLQLVTPTSDLSLADELNRELLRRLSEAITNMVEEDNYWDVVKPVTTKSSKGEGKTSKEFVRSILEEKIDEIERREEMEVIPVQEAEPIQEESKPEDYVYSVRENYNHAQKILSLLGIDFEEYKRANTQTKTNILRETLKENYSKFILKEPENPVVCPCTQELKTLTKSECTCEAGICKPPKELDAEEMEYIKKHLPYGPGVECFRIMIEGIHKMLGKDLTVQEQSEEIKNILLNIQNRETTNGPCQCILHTIDVEKIEEDAKYMKDMILTNLDQKLDEKYEDLIGVRHTESKEVQIEQCVKVTENEKIVVCADICEECGALICKCGKKKRNRKKGGMKHKKDAKGSCTIDCGCHMQINC